MSYLAFMNSSNKLGTNMDACSFAGKLQKLITVKVQYVSYVSLK